MVWWALVGDSGVNFDGTLGVGGWGGVNLDGLSTLEDSRRRWRFTSTSVC